MQGRRGYSGNYGGRYGRDLGMGSTNLTPGCTPPSEQMLASGDAEGRGSDKKAVTKDPNEEGYCTLSATMDPENVSCCVGMTIENPKDSLGKRRAKRRLFTAGEESGEIVDGKLATTGEVAEIRIDTHTATGLKRGVQMGKAWSTDQIGQDQVYIGSQPVITKYKLACSLFSPIFDKKWKPFALGPGPYQKEDGVGRKATVEINALLGSQRGMQTKVDEKVKLRGMRILGQWVPAQREVVQEETLNTDPDIEDLGFWFSEEEGRRALTAGKGSLQPTKNKVPPFVITRPVISCTPFIPVSTRTHGSVKR